MSLKNEILEILNTPKFKYKGIPVNALFFPALRKYKSKTIQNNFYSLNKQGYIEKLDGNFIINKNGKLFLEKPSKLQLKIFEPAENNSPKNLLLLYDVPEAMKKERDWFRRTLIKFSFIMIQKSVWVGPSPLPKEFLDYVKSIGLKDSIKTFKLEKGYHS
jgi:phenylacetic acid degradation operon negative regulatory protein